jgi:aryl-alcohol dehydrogenase-like predicted oxidoreductase
MDYRLLGQTGMKVSRLCFGGLTIGPLQARLPLGEGVTVIQTALASGVNFIDTAQLYGTYPYIAAAIKGYPECMVVSKSYAYTYDDMRKSVEEACQQIGRDYIDIFMLHEQVSKLTLRGHGEGLAYLVDAKKQGLVRAIGVSTHTVEVVQAAADLREVDVIHPILNMAGIGIMDGSAADMLKAIHRAAGAGKGIYTMKALGGGHLFNQADQALRWILSWDHIASVAVGMQSVAEVAVNCQLFSGTLPITNQWRQVQGQQRRLLVEEWCSGCGTCVTKCPMQAMDIRQGRAVPQAERCVLCGYCGAYCPDFCLKII